MLRHLRCSVERWPLERPFRISRGVKTAAEVVTVEIEEEGRIGRGEAVPYARYGETLDSVRAQVGSITEVVVRGADRTALMRLLPPGAARNVVDCALWDIDLQAGRATLPPLPGSIPTALTVSLDAPERMAEAAAALAGVPLVKVKVDATDPVAAIEAVRRAAPDARLIVDPNESWTLDLLVGLQGKLEALRVAMIEQPLPADGDGGLDTFQHRVPICADESCHVAADLPALARRYDMVNIKLDKAGGLTGALELFAAARAARFGIMVGCMVSTSLSIAPALSVARQAAFVDLDGPWWLRQDRDGGVIVKDGMLTPPAPGFWGTCRS